MYITRYSFGHKLLGPVGIYELHPKEAAVLRRCHSYVHWVSHKRKECSASTATAARSAKREYCYSHCASQERGCVVLGYAMAVSRRE